MNRKEAREFAMQVVFHMEIHKDFAAEALMKFPKYEEKASAFIVAEETITLNSGRACKTRFNNPRTKSIFKLLS